MELNVRQNSKACDTRLFLNFKEQNECCLPELGQIYRMPEFVAFSPRMELTNRRPRRLEMSWEGWATASARQLVPHLYVGQLQLFQRRSRGPFFEHPEKPYVKLRLAFSVKLIFSRVAKGRKIKITAKFLASRRFHFEDAKGIMSPEMRANSFRTLEKRAPGFSPVSTLLFR